MSQSLVILKSLALRLYNLCKTYKYFVIFFLIILSLLAFRGAGDQKKHSVVQTSNKMLFSIKNISSEERNIEIKTTGYVRPYKSLNIMTQIHGNASKIYVKNGQFAKKGEILIELDKEDLLEALNASKVNEKNNKAKYEAAKSLYEKGFVTETYLNDLLYAYKSSEEKRIKSENDVNHAYIRAPFNGYVSNLKPDEGEYTSSISGPIMKLVDMSKVLVDTSISPENAKYLKVGDDCKVSLRGKDYKANIYEINKTLDPITRSSILKVIISDKSCDIFDGEIVDVFLYKKESKVNKLSASWVSINDIGILGIKTISNDGIVKFSPITIIDDDNDYVFIKSIGDDIKIITDGHEFAEDGRKIHDDQILISK